MYEGSVSPSTSLTMAEHRPGWLSLQPEINDLEAMEAKAGSGALSEIPADDDHMSARSSPAAHLPLCRPILSSVLPNCPGLGECFLQQTGPWPLLCLCHLTIL